MYRWDGTKYREANADFPEFFRERTDEYIRLVSATDERFSALDIADFCRNAVHGLFYQGKYGDALRLIREVLERREIAASAMALSVVHISLGDVHRALGQLNEATKNYERAATLSPSREAEKKLNEAKLLLQRPRERGK